MPFDLSVSRRLNGERLTLFGWSRAILLQLAHPLVAAGVADHSSFRLGPATAAARLHHTVRAMLSLTFGSEARRGEAIARISGIHRTVNGRLRDAVGPFAAGTEYSAEDSELLIWVHATLLESIPMIYERLVGPLTTEERDSYCQEAASVARDLGAREGDIPRSWQALQEYLFRMYESGRIVVGGTAKELAAAVLSPPFASLVAPAASLNRAMTVGLLPAAIRAQYGFGWSEQDEAALRRWTRVIHRVRPFLPDALALWADARRARPDAHPA